MALFQATAKFRLCNTHLLILIGPGASRGLSFHNREQKSKTNHRRTFETSAPVKLSNILLARASPWRKRRKTKKVGIHKGCGYVCGGEEGGFSRKNTITTK